MKNLALRLKVRCCWMCVGYQKISPKMRVRHGAAGWRQTHASSMRVSHSLLRIY